MTVWRIWWLSWRFSILTFTNSSPDRELCELASFTHLFGCFISYSWICPLIYSFLYSRGTRSLLGTSHCLGCQHTERRTRGLTSFIPFTLGREIGHWAKPHMCPQNESLERKQGEGSWSEGRLQWQHLLSHCQESVKNLWPLPFSASCFDPANSSRVWWVRMGQSGQDCHPHLQMWKSWQGL